MNYGVHYTAYRENPAHCHSEFCIQIVDNIDENVAGCGDTDNTNSSSSGRGADNGVGCMEQMYVGSGGVEVVNTPTWSHVSALTRIMPVCMYNVHVYSMYIVCKIPVCNVCLM